MRESLAASRAQLSQVRNWVIFWHRLFSSLLFSLLYSYCSYYSVELLFSNAAHGAWCLQRCHAGRDGGFRLDNCFDSPFCAMAHFHHPCFAASRWAFA